MGGKWAGLSAFGGALAVLFAAIATNGEKTLAVLGGVPKLLAAWTSGLPLGTGAWLAVVFMGAGLWLFLIPRLPRGRDGGRSHLMADNIVILVVGTMVTALQLLGPVPSTAGSVLMAVTIGAIGGFVSCWLGRVARWTWIHFTTPKGCP